jgi:hypothetical protein
MVVDSTISAGGHAGMSKAALLTLRAVEAAAVIVRLMWPLTLSPLRVWTEAVFVFSLLNYV